MQCNALSTETAGVPTSWPTPSPSTFTPMEHHAGTPVPSAPLCRAICPDHDVCWRELLQGVQSNFPPVLRASRARCLDSVSHVELCANALVPRRARRSDEEGLDVKSRRQSGCHRELLRNGTEVAAQRRVGDRGGGSEEGRR